MNHVYSNLQNWAQRMGGSAVKDKDLKGENISTVGVDISDLVLQKGGREVLFSTWDFGGQVIIDNCVTVTKYFQTLLVYA